MAASRTGLLLVSVVALLVGACAGPMSVRMSDESRAELKTYPGIRAVHYIAPMLVVTTTGRVLLDDVTLASVPQKDLSKRYGIPDPAPTVKMMLVQSLERDAGFRKLAVVDQPLAGGNDDTLKDLTATYSKGVVLDVKNINWGGMYFTTNWMRYQLGLGIRARLVRLDDQKVLWKGTCWYNAARDAKLEPTMDELTANNAALFRKIYADAGQHCGRQLANELLNRDGKS